MPFSSASSARAHPPDFCRWLGLLLLGLCLCGTALPFGVAAQSAQARQPASPAEAALVGSAGLRRLLLLRQDPGARPELTGRVESALSRELTQLGFRVTASPLPFEDGQLAAGCSGAVRECGAEVARVLESEHLAVAALEGAPEARDLRLHLFIFASGEPPREASALLAREPRALEASVRALVARAFNTNAAQSLAARTSDPALTVPVPSAHDTEVPPSLSPGGSAQQPSSAPNPALRAVGWTTFGVGGALLVSALATQLSAEKARLAYARTDKESPANVDQALAQFEHAQRRSDAAAVLWGVGAGAAAAGAFVLLWERFKRPAERNLRMQPTSLAARTRLQLALSPARGSFALAVRGVL